MTMTAKYNGTCRTCGKSITKGEKIEWTKDGGAKHISCASNRVSPRSMVASSKQINYALNLLHKLGPRGWHDTDMGQGSPMPNRTEVEGMTGREVSALINDCREACY